MKQTVAALLALGAICRCVSADIIVAKDGRKLEGIVESQEGGKVVLLDPKTMKLLVNFPAEQVDKIDWEGTAVWTEAFEALDERRGALYFKDAERLTSLATRHANPVIVQVSAERRDLLERTKEIWQLADLPMPPPDKSMTQLRAEFDGAIDKTLWNEAYEIARIRIAYGDQGSAFLAKFVEVCRNLDVDSTAKLADAPTDNKSKKTVVYHDVRVRIADLYRLFVADGLTAKGSGSQAWVQTGEAAKDNQMLRWQVGEIERTICTRVENFLAQEQKTRMDWRNYSFMRGRLPEVYSLLVMRAYLLEFVRINEKFPDARRILMENSRRLAVATDWDMVKWVGMPDEWNPLIFTPSPENSSECYTGNFMEALKMMALDKEESTFAFDQDDPLLAEALQHFKRIYVNAASTDVAAAVNENSGESRAGKATRIGLLRRACSDLAMKEVGDDSLAASAKVLYKYCPSEGRQAMAVVWEEELTASVWAGEERSEELVDMLGQLSSWYLVQGAKTSNRDRGMACKGPSPDTPEWKVMAAQTASRAPIGSFKSFDAVPFDRVLETSVAVARAPEQLREFAFRIEPCLVDRAENGERGPNAARYVVLLCKERLMQLDRRDEAWRLLRAGAMMRSASRPGEGFDDPQASHIALTAMDVLPEGAAGPFLQTFEESRLVPALTDKPDSIGGLRRAFEASLLLRLDAKAPPASIWESASHMADAAFGKGASDFQLIAELAESRVVGSERRWDTFFAAAFDSALLAPPPENALTFDVMGMMAGKLAQRYNAWVDQSGHMAGPDNPPPSDLPLAVGMLLRFPALAEASRRYMLHQALAVQIDAYESGEGIRAAAKLLAAISSRKNVEQAIQEYEAMQHEWERYAQQALEIHSAGLSKRILAVKAREELADAASAYAGYLADKARQQQQRQ